MDKEIVEKMILGVDLDEPDEQERIKKMNEEEFSNY